MTTHTYPDSPKVGVGALVFHNNRVLLIKRGKSPSKGMWTVPGGRLELGESLQEAAEREVLEETSVTVKAENPLYIFDMVAKDDNGRIKYHFVIVDIAAQYIEGDPKPGDDAADAGWFKYEELERLGVGEKTMALLERHWPPKSRL